MGIIVDAFKSLFKTITKLSRPYFTLEENQLKFKIESDNFYYFPISNIETKTRHDPYVLEAFTLTAKQLYLEYIHTDMDVSWNGQAFSFFISLLKRDIRAKTMDLLEKKEFNHYDLMVYKIDNSYILNLIYIYELDKEIFIVDLKGNLYEGLLKNFEKDYKYEFERNKKLNLTLNTSVVRNNAIQGYFRTTSGGE
ncbi:MAG: hypothetical protein KA157_05165 [Aliarcobacter sp.]|nr:hypothetical protein [Aliarcobacter sp.]